MMKSAGLFNEVDGYLLAWFVPSILKFTGNSGASTVILFSLFILWSLYNMFLLHNRCRVTKFVVTYDLLVAMFSIYGFFLLLSGETLKTTETVINNRMYLLNIYISLLPFYSFYYYTLQGRLSLKKIYIWALPFFAAAYLDYFFQLEFALTKYAAGLGISDDVVNNGSYSVLGLLPLVCLFKKKYLQILILAICTYFIATSFKRGPIMILMIYFIYYTIVSLNTKHRMRWLFFFFPIILYAGYLFFSNLYVENYLFQYRIEQTLDGYSSGRDNIVGKLWDYYISNSNLFQLLFGYGAYSTIKVAGNAAHNDWLEILFCQGLVGALIYFSYWLGAFRYWIMSDKDDRMVLGAFFIIYFSASFFSMSYSDIPIYAMLIFAYLVAQNELKNSMAHVRM